MLVRASTYKADTSRYQGPSPVAIIAILLGGYLGITVCFYWLMQPTVVRNNGLAAYRPPPATVVSAVPSVPPAPSEALVALAEPPQDFTESPVAAPKKEVAKREARTAPRRERVVREPVRERSYQGWDSYASSNRSYGGGSRPWF
jgi:hypothetical protein